MTRQVAPTSQGPQKRRTHDKAVYLKESRYERPKAVFLQMVDVAFMTGVHSIFDDFRPCFSNLLHWVRPGGRIYVCGLFNSFPVDVWISYQLAEGSDTGYRETGWNLFSKQSVGRYLDAAVGTHSYRFIPIELPFDLPQQPDDPLRTWTFRDSDGRRRFTNGLSIICPLEILEIAPKERP